jgi:hypothetical protein
MLTEDSEMRTASIIALMMEAVRTSETSFNLNSTTRRYIPDDCKLQAKSRLNSPLVPG